MKNLAMERKVMSMQAVDLAEHKRAGPGLYILPTFTDGVDYCDSSTEEWIWSIGQNEETGEIIASTDASYYQRPGWKCLWLR
jgi:hypothetical protein